MAYLDLRMPFEAQVPEGWAGSSRFKLRRLTVRWFGRPSAPRGRGSLLHRLPWPGPAPAAVQRVSAARSLSLPGSARSFFGRDPRSRSHLEGVEFQETLVRPPKTRPWKILGKGMESHWKPMLPVNAGVPKAIVDLLSKPIFRLFAMKQLFRC